MAKYRRIYPLIWDDEVFQDLSADEQRIVLYALTCRATNRVGIFCFSEAEAAEKLKLPLARFRKGFRNACQRLEWCYDEQRRVLYIPTWWKWNAPENPNVLKGNLEDLKEVPKTPLLDVFASNLTYLPAEYHPTFRERCGNVWGTLPPTSAKGTPQPFGKGILDPFPKQEQEQEQEQEPIPPTPPGGFERFWEAYPWKAQQEDARKAWEQLNPDEALTGTILRALSEQCARWRVEDPPKTPRPAKWLRERWFERPTNQGPTGRVRAPAGKYDAVEARAMRASACCDGQVAPGERDHGG